jgi:hypothetical protein
MQSDQGGLRQLKGSPLSCLLALILAGQPVGEQYLCERTGYTPNSVRNALRCLELLGLASRLQRFSGWALTESAWQEPLLVALGSLSAGLPPQGGPESRKTTLPLTTTTATDVEGTSPTEAAAAAAALKRQKLSLETQKLNLAALYAAGIKGRMADELSRLPHVTPEYIHAHALQVLAQGRTIPILICRIRDGDPAPESHEERLRRERRLYIDGTLADFIEH